MKNFVFIFFIFCSVACFSQSYPYGKVRVVNSYADYKVRVVTSFPDLQVEKVNAYADSPGKWQFVDAYEDFTVEFVNAFEDFTIEWVDHVSTSYPAPNSHNVTVYGGGEVLKYETFAYDVNPQNCTFSVKRPDGIKQYPLCAKVKLVSSNADVVVYDATYTCCDAEVFIDTTSTTPTECCWWQYVDSCYDFTVQIVKDLTQPVDLAAHFCYRPIRSSLDQKMKPQIGLRWINKKR